jgi:hypothetical protein
MAGGGGGPLQNLQRITGLCDFHVTFVPAQRTISIGYCSHHERRVSKSAIGLLTLAIYATALVVVPMVTPAEAATNSSGEIGKNKKKVQKSLGVGDPRSSNPVWPPPMYDDFDRKNGGGGGM